MSLSLRQRAGLEMQRMLRKNEEQLHPLRSLFWECTLRCNMNCRHCGSDCRVVSDVKDMPAEDFLKAIDGLTPHVNPNEVFIIVTGGEPLLRADLERVGLELYRRGYPWGMVTNGMLLDEKRLESLLASGMHSVSVSIDGFEEKHNWVRRNGLSFERAVRAIRLLAKEKDVLWDVVTCVNGRNYDDMRAFKTFLYEQGVRSWRIFCVFPMGRAQGDDELQLNKVQFRGLLDFVEECRKKGDGMDVSYSCEGYLGTYEQRVRDYMFFCRSGVEVASIRCDGAISGCTSVRSKMDQGNIYEDDLWQVWQERFQTMRDRRWAKKEQCASCKAWRYCEGGAMHLYDDESRLIVCRYQGLEEK